MAEEAEGNSTVVEKYLDDIVFKVMRENAEFLNNNAEEAYGEIVELANDAIKYFGLPILKGESREKEFVKRSMAFFLYHVLWPFSGAIHTDVLTGNVPACFMELRLMLESLAKCYLADLRYPERTFFQERLELLEEFSKEEKWSTSRLMRELGKQLGLGRDFLALWSRLSQDWVHTKGIMDRVVNQVVERSDVPPWALVIPMSYTENDLGALDELCKRISQFRKLLTATVERYQQELGLRASPPLPDSV